MNAPALTGLARWAVEALIASMLLMVLVLLVRVLVRRAFGPQLAYALWMLPLLRLVLPPLPAGWREVAATPISRAGETMAVLIVPSDMPVAAAAPSIPSLLVVLAVAWAIGVAGLLFFHLVGYARFCRRIVAAADLLEVRQGIRIVTSAAAAGPVAFGVWRRYVAFPIDFADRYEAEERALALAHEIGHHQRGDLIANWVALVVLALHWCNPIAWRAFHAFRADQELANDARMLAGCTPSDRHVYACAIVKTAHGGAASAICHLRTITDLKGRLKMLSLSPASRRRLASGTAVVGAVVVAGLALTASGSSAAAISAGVQDAVAQTTPSAPPVPPASATDRTPAADREATNSTTAHKVRNVVVVKDGKTTVYDSADVDAHLAANERVTIRPLAPDSSRMIFKVSEDPSTTIEVQDIPAIRSATCGIGTGQPTSMVVNTGNGGKRMIVICTDRVRQVTANAMVTASSSKEIERNAYARALTGLTDARARIVANSDIADADRSRALAAIDMSITEMKGQIARFN